MTLLIAGAGENSLRTWYLWQQSNDVHTVVTHLTDKLA